MRLDGRLVVGVFFGSAVLGSTTAGQEEMCGGEVTQRGRLEEKEAAFQLCKLFKFNVKLEGMEIKTLGIYRHVTHSHGFGLELL